MFPVFIIRSFWLPFLSEKSSILELGVGLPQEGETYVNMFFTLGYTHLLITKKIAENIVEIR